MWLHEDVYTNGDLFFEDVIHHIHSAKDEILCQYYIFENDKLGNKFLASLLQAAKRGVEVKLIVDGIGSHQRLNSAIKSTNLFQWRIFNPLPFFLLERPFTRWLPKTFLSLTRQLNQRSHVKITLIDKKNLFLGGMNVSSVHLGTQQWRDTSCLVTGNNTHIIRELFYRVWNRSWRQTKKIWIPAKPRIQTYLTEKIFSDPFDEHDPDILVNDQIRMRFQNYKRLLTKIRTARHRVWIQNAYFVPRNSLIQALAQARVNGADVRIMVGQKSDIFFMPWVTSLYYERILKHQILLLEYTRTILHTKSIIIDDIAMVGSSNLNQRSLRSDIEADVVLKKPESIQNLLKAFQKDLLYCTQIKSEDLENITWNEKILGRLFSLFKAVL